VKTATASAFPANRQHLPLDGRLNRHADAEPHTSRLAGVVLLLPGLACAAWAIALPPGSRAFPVLLLSVWGVVAIWALPIEDTMPVVLLCLSVSTAELPGMPLEEMGPLFVVALWVARSLLGVLLRRGRGRVPRNASVSVIAAILALLACNLVVMGYQGIAVVVWVKNALPWLLCLAAYPVSRIRWTQVRFDRTVDMLAFTGSMVSVADIVQFIRAGGIAGSAEVGGEAFVSMLPLLAIVAILASWERSRVTVGSAARKLGLLAGFAVCLVRIAMSLQRAWLIGAVVGLGVWIWAGRSQHSSGVRRLASTSTLVLSVTIALALVAPASKLFQDAYRGLVARISGSWVGGAFDYSIGTRLVEVTAAMQSLRDSPLFGTGLGSVIDKIGRNGLDYSMDYIHIGPVFVLTKLGIVGFAVVGWLIVRVASALRRARVQVAYISGFLCAELCVVGVLFAVTRYVFKPSNAALVWLLIGMALSLQNDLRDRGVSGTVNARNRR
jgi:hypothetical protein